MRCRSRSLRHFLSEPRMAPYLHLTRGDESAAVALQAWSARMAAPCFEVVGHLEILLRNAMDQALATHYEEEKRRIPWFLQAVMADTKVSDTVAATRTRLGGSSKDHRDQIVAGMTLGFWTGMFGPKYEQLWVQCLYRAFPHSPGTRKQLMVPLEEIRKFRNRIAHHESMIKVDVPFEMKRIHQVAGYIDPQVGDWLRSIDRTSSVYAERPRSPIDTVVVAGRHAWPLYQQSHVYVCQAGRSLQPVERIAFYADKEIKPEVPAIIARRDNVTWPETEADRLESSDDRIDRKVATAIRSSRAHGWTEGRYQVFLLSRAGNSGRHRSLPAPVPHLREGRGSAFTQGQRYVSLHKLETARTTDDL